MRLFPLRDEIYRAQKPAKLTPRFDWEDPDRATVRRFKDLRERCLAATPFVIRGDIEPRRNSDVLFPPFAAVWLEWADKYYKVGAHVSWSSVGTLVTWIVISGRKRMSFHLRSDAIHLDDSGIFVRRADFSAALWPGRREHERSAFEHVYDVLAYINRPGAAVDELGGGHYQVGHRQPPRREIINSVVDITDTAAAAHEDPHQDPAVPVMPLHEVRGHPRHYKSGKVSWVRPHTRGDSRNGTRIPTYRVAGEKPPSSGG